MNELLDRVGQLWQQSSTVLEDCALPNGAIVAANNELPGYPSTGEGYRYVWMRDNAFQLIAANMINPSVAVDRSQRYQGWLWDRAQGFADDGVVLKRYHTHGAADDRYGRDYQPDQAGAMLWALGEVMVSGGYEDKLTDRTMRQLANGLASQWGGGHFKVPTQDLWENTSTSPLNGDSFTYTLAACSYGLDKAIARWRGKREGETSRWEEAATQIRSILAIVPPDGYYRKKIYPVPQNDPNNKLDASLLGLVYPFASAAETPTALAAQRTAEQIGRQLMRQEGNLRYTGDSYSGIAGNIENGAGSWPLLTFRGATVQACLGDSEMAKTIFIEQIDQLSKLYEDEDIPVNHIPEQIFRDRGRQGTGVSPLGWAHAEFVITTNALGLVPDSTHQAG